MSVTERTIAFVQEPGEASQTSYIREATHWIRSLACSVEMKEDESQCKLLDGITLDNVSYVLRRDLLSSDLICSYFLEVTCS